MILPENIGRQFAWQDALKRFPPSLQDVYFLPEYHQMHEANGDGEPQFTDFSEGDSSLLVPGLRIPVGDLVETNRYWVFQSCNGYGGPLASPDSSAQFLESAWAEWRRASRGNGIVAGFFRLHPLLKNERWLPSSARVVLDRQTMFVDFADGAKAAWGRADSRHRNMVNKGRRDGVCVRWDDAEDWRNFESLYGESMGRLNAAQSLRFSPAYFAAMRKLPGAHLACVPGNGQIDAGAVFMFGPTWAHYHLSARRPDAGNHLTNVMLQSAVERAAEKGLTGLHLGGGRTRDPNDGLLKFKQSLGGRLLDFKLALVVADEDAYEGLCAEWARETGAKPEWLLAYRQPKPTPERLAEAKTEVQ